LFIRTPDEMQPTPRSEQMAGPVRDALRMLSLALEPQSFDPAESGRGFTLAVNNYAARALGTARRVAGAVRCLVAAASTAAAAPLRAGRREQAMQRKTHRQSDRVEVAGNEADPRTLAPFSGPKINAGSSDDCGRLTTPDRSDADHAAVTKAIVRDSSLDYAGRITFAVTADQVIE
jgi:hypothetical protein